MYSNPANRGAAAVRSDGRPWSLATRLAFFYTACAATLLLVAMLILYGVVIQHINADDNLFLIDKLGGIRAELAEGGASAEDLLADEVPAGTRDYFVRVLDRKTGAILAELPQTGEKLPTSLFPSALPKERIPPAGSEYKTPAGHWFLLMSATAVLDRSSPKEVLIQIARDRSGDKAFTENFSKLFLAVLIGGIVSSAAVARLAVKRALRPLEEMATATEKVQASRLNQRLGRGRWPNELISLAAGFDQMLARLEESFDRLSQFSADLAHELRTPIQNLRCEAEVTLARTRTANEYREVVESSIEEYQRLASMIDSLLFLARTENAETRVDKAKLEVGPEIDTILDLYDAAAREQNVAVTRQGDARVNADPMLFRRALNNVVSNALQHTPSGGQVQVSVVSEPDETVAIKVQDSGYGIGPEHLSRIFDRFYRADAARSSNPAGTGLGLAIVKSIMELHGGLVSAESRVGVGTIVTLTFVENHFHPSAPYP
jgi:two-component system heavy metal sensor histidine kinase CusS